MASSFLLSVDVLICIVFAALLLRLQGPSAASGTGRLEIFHNGQWGTICGYYWGMNDAKVACRELGYKYTIRALSGSSIPDGTGQIWLSYVSCNGNEISLSSCDHAGWGNHNCEHRNDVGVECSSTGTLYFTQNLLNLNCETLKM